MLPSLVAAGLDLSRCISVQDNAPAHQPKAIKQAFPEAGVSLLNLPASSPDHNPLDYHVWGAMDALLVHDAPSDEGYPTTRAWQGSIIAAWKKLEEEGVHKTILSLSRRCRKCVER